MTRFHIFLLLICALLITGGSSLFGQAVLDDKPSSNPRLVKAIERWNQLSPKQRKAILKAHTALQKLPATRREGLIDRVRELEPGDSTGLIDKIDQFLKSSVEEQKKLRRRRIAFRMWKWNLNDSERDHFRHLAPKARGEFLRKAIHDKETVLLQKMPQQERDRLMKLPNHVRWETLDLRSNRRRPPDSPRIQRVLHLAHRLNRDEMNNFIGEAVIPPAHPRLAKAMEALSKEEKEGISRFLRRVLKRPRNLDEPPAHRGRRPGPGRDGVGPGNGPGRPGGSPPPRVRPSRRDGVGPGSPPHPQVRPQERSGEHPQRRPGTRPPARDKPPVGTDAREPQFPSLDDNVAGDLSGWAISTVSAENVSTLRSERT